MVLLSSTCWVVPMSPSLFWVVPLSPLPFWVVLLSVIGWSCSPPLNGAAVLLTCLGGAAYSSPFGVLRSFFFLCGLCLLRSCGWWSFPSSLFLRGFALSIACTPPCPFFSCLLWFCFSFPWSGADSHRLGRAAVSLGLLGGNAFLSPFFASLLVLCTCENYEYNLHVFIYIHHQKTRGKCE